jgi:hypothetical protein
MTVKDAATNSLLMFVAATCVVLIVKAMPQTQATVQGEAGSNSGTNGSAAQRGNTATPTLAMRDGVRVYYLHGNIRCPTCRTIEAYAQEAVQSGFAAELQAGKIEWQVVNYQTPGNEHFAADYNVVAPNVVLVRFKDGRQIAWKGLSEVWEHTGDKGAFFTLVQTSLREFLQGAEAKAPAPRPPRPTPIPSPENAPLPIPE